AEEAALRRSSGSCARSRLGELDEGRLVGADLPLHPVEHAGGDAGVDGQRHQGFAALLAPANLHASDVDAPLPQQRPDPTPPGGSRRRRTALGGAGAMSTAMPLMATSRSWSRGPTVVPETPTGPREPSPDRVIRFTQSRLCRVLDSGHRMPRSAASRGAFT